MSSTVSHLNAITGASGVKSKAKRRYALWPKESIQVIGQQLGLDRTVTNEALLELSSDVSYRLRQLLDNAIKHMANTKTTRLTTAHITTALEAQHCENVLGFEANDSPIGMESVKVANVFVPEDPIVDLQEEVTKILDKTVCNVKVFKSDIQLDLDWIAMNSTLTFNDHNIDNNGTDLSEELKKYYQNIVKAILGTDHQLFVKILRDLSSNCLYSPIVPHLLNFIFIGIKKQMNDISQLKRFLNTIECLLKNESVFLATDPYINVLIQSILICIIDELNPSSDHWTLRDSASHLLVKALNERFSQFVVNRQKKKTFEYLRNCLLDSSKSFGSHYGALKAFQSLGYDVIIEYLTPILNRYFNHLLPAIDSSKAQQQIRSDGLIVFGELLFIGELICNKTRSLIENSCQTNVDFKLYYQLSDIFGDSLFARLSINFNKIRHKFYLPKSTESSKRHLNLFETQESLKTGEELLDAFYETPAQTEDIRSSLSATIDEDFSGQNSVVSDNDPSMATDMLQIKSTINDPTLGIKLTIKKLKRDQKESQKLVKRMRFSADNTSEEPVFETIPLKQNSIRFNISGLSISDVFIDKPIKAYQYYPSQWFSITTTQPIDYCLRRNKCKLGKCQKQLSLYSCDLLNVL